MPLILPGNVASATASTTYTVANSCRFNDDDGAYLNKTNGTPTDTKKCTLSMWFKRCELSDSNNFLFGNWTGTTDYAYVRLQADDTIKYTSIVSSSTDADLITTQVFRDCSAWYHIVLALDTEQGTAANRAKLYINGTQVTSFSTEDYPAEDATTQFTENLSSGGFQIGSDKDTGSRYYDGYMAEVVVIDGTQYAASDFGEFDEDSPTIWKPKNVSGLTFGDNGAYLDFEDSDNLGDDESGNTNDWTENNLAAADQATDTPTNNFATLNILDTYYSADVYSEGNTKITTTTGGHAFHTATFGLSKSKWYWEVKVDNWEVGDQTSIGISADTADGTDDELINNTGTRIGYGYYGGGYAYGGGVDLIGGQTYSEGSGDHIIGVALDLDNDKIHWSFDGTWQGSSAPATNTNGEAITDVSSGTVHGLYFPAISAKSVSTMEVNFGNPSFSITSGNADDNGYGNFEYDVPSGFYALCTKNLAEFG